MRSARNGAAAGECKCPTVQRGKQERKREKVIESEKKESWIRERENAGAATSCKRKIYKLESPIKSVPAVTTSPLFPFHIERRLFVSFLSSLFSSSSSSSSAVTKRSDLANPELATRKMERQAKSTIRKSESRVTMTRFVARDSVRRNISESLISPELTIKLNFYAEKKKPDTIYA